MCEAASTSCSSVVIWPRACPKWPSTADTHATHHLVAEAVLQVAPSLHLRKQPVTLWAGMQPAGQLPAHGPRSNGRVHEHLC